MNDLPPIIAAILLHPEDAYAIREYAEEHGIDALNEIDQGPDVVNDNGPTVIEEPGVNESP